MAGTYTVVVLDSDGKEVDRWSDLDVQDAGSNAFGTGQTYSDAELAVWLASPEICPWDCDHCREE